MKYLNIYIYIFSMVIVIVVTAFITFKLTKVDIEELQPPNPIDTETFVIQDNIGKEDIEKLGDYIVQMNDDILLLNSEVAQIRKYTRQTREEMKKIEEFNYKLKTDLKSIDKQYETMKDVNLTNKQLLQLFKTRFDAKN